MDDLPGSKPFFVGVGPSQVEVELIERGLSEELGAVAKGFQVVELIFNQAVDRLDVALVGVSSRGDALVLGAEVSDRPRKVRARAVGLQLADEFAAVVGLPGHVTQVHPAALQVPLNPLGEEFAGWGGAPGSVGQEL